MTAYTDFLSDPQRREVFVVEYTVKVLATGATTTLYHSDVPYATVPTDTPANTPTKADVVSPFNFTSDAVQPGTLGRLPGFRGGEIIHGQVRRHLDAYATTYAWDGAGVRVLHVGESRYGVLPYPAASAGASDGVLMRAEVAGTPQVTPEKMTVRLRDLRERLESPLSVRRYRQTGGWWLGIGAGGSIGLGAPTKLDLTGDFVLEGWFRLPGGFGTENLAQWDGATFPFRWQVLSTGALRIRSSSWSADVDSATGRVTNARQYHLAVIKVGTAIRHVVYDEASNTETVDSGTASSSSNAAGAGNVVLASMTAGAYTGTGETRLWVPPADIDAALALVRNRRFRWLSSTEVDASMRAVYRISEGTGTTITDYGTGTAANGTTAGVVAWVHSCHPDELVGRQRPTALGQIQSGPLIPVAPAILVYECAGHICSTTSLVVREGGAAITSGTNRVTMVALLTTAPTAGTFDYAFTVNGSYIRLGSQPTLPLTWDGRGDSTGSGYVSTVPTVAQRLLEARGTAPWATADIDTTALGALPAWTVGYWTDQEVTVGQALDEILGSGEAAGWVTRAGKFTARRWSGVSGSVVLTLDERDILDLTGAEVEPPAWETVVGYLRRHRVLTLDELAGSIRGTKPESLYTTPVSRARRISASTLAAHLRARTVSRDGSGVASALTAETEAAEHAQHLLDTLDAPARGYRLRCRLRGLPADYYDRLTVEIDDLDGSRLAADFAILGSEVLHVDHTVTYVAWG